MQWRAPQSFPQRTKNLRVTDKHAVLADEVILERYRQINSRIAGSGRALLRASGTEPMVRVMIECDDETKREHYLSELCELIRKRGYCCE